MFTSMYKNVEEDFGNEDAAKLDTWVFNEARSFFGGAINNETLKNMLYEEQIVFFFHLLGKYKFLKHIAPPTFDTCEIQSFSSSFATIFIFLKGD